MEVWPTAHIESEHDRSKNLLQYNAILRQLIDHKDGANFTQSKIASVNFPLKLTEVVQVDSKDSPAVQVADVLIGGAIEAESVIEIARGGL